MLIIKWQKHSIDHMKLDIMHTLQRTNKQAYKQWFKEETF